MAETVLPLSAAKIVTYRTRTEVVGQQSVVGEDGRRHFGGGAVRRVVGVVELQVRTDGDQLANEKAFRDWHESLSGNDNQTSLVPFAGRYGSDVRDEVLSYDWSAIGGSLGLGALEATSDGRLVAPAMNDLVYVDSASGTPDTASPVGSLLTPGTANTWFTHERNVGGLVQMADGSWIVGFDPTLPRYVVMLPSGKLKTDLSTSPNLDIATFATDANTALPGGVQGLAITDSTLRIVLANGAIYSCPVANVLATQQSTAFGFNMDYCPVTLTGTIANTTAVAGAWTVGGKMRMLANRQTTDYSGWGVWEVDFGGAVPTATLLLQVADRGYRGAVQIGTRTYVAADNRLRRLSSAAIRVNLLADGIDFPKRGKSSLPTIAYAFEELV